MPKDGELVKAARHGEFEEVRRLLANANIEEKDVVSDGGGTSVAA
jgi:hypothetical protein